MEGWKRVDFGGLNCRRSMIALTDVIRILLSGNTVQLCFDIDDHGRVKASECVITQQIKGVGMVCITHKNVEFDNL